MSNFQVFTNHPIISHPESTADEKHYVTISSQDRNVTKYPNANDFTIDLPQDYTNVKSVRLASSYFPIVDDQFALDQNNVRSMFSF